MENYEKLLEKLQMQQLLEEKNGRISLTEYGRYLIATLRYLRNSSMFCRRISVYM